MSDRKLRAKLGAVYFLLCLGMGVYGNAHASTNLMKPVSIKKNPDACLGEVNLPPQTKQDFECIDEGFRVFTEETFEGNGRTCSTCHLPAESYNIFPSTMHDLTPNELSLVLADNVPGLENELLVKARAIFNIAGDETSDATNIGTFSEGGHENPIFRSTMGLFGLDLTIKNGDLNFPGTPLLPAECSAGEIDGVRVANLLPQLGWSGDGSPGTMRGDENDACRTHHGNVDINADGTIRAFANGAIAQHATKTLNRVAKTTACPGLDINNPNAICNGAYDFRFATDRELTALELFQRWLGRRRYSETEPEIPLAFFDFKDSRIDMARDHFNGPPQLISPQMFGAGCTTCHLDGGARSGFVPVFPTLFMHNNNFNTHVELAGDDIGLAVVGAPLPHDEGADNFVPDMQPPMFAESFNSQSIIESAQKKSWFHNHREIGSFEDAVDFYTSSDFQSNLLGPATTTLGLQFGDGKIAHFPKGDGIEHLAALLRVLNAYYNLRDCERLLDEAVARINVGVSPTLPLTHCEFALSHASTSLNGSKLRPLPYGYLYWEVEFLYFQVAFTHFTKNQRYLKRQIQIAKRRVTRLKNRIATVASTEE